MGPLRSNFNGIVSSSYNRNHIFTPKFLIDPVLNGVIKKYKEERKIDQDVKKTVRLVDFSTFELVYLSLYTGQDLLIIHNNNCPIVKRNT